MTGAASSAAHAREQVVHRLGELRVVPVVSLARPQDAAALAQALAAGGLPCVEIALRTEAGIEAIRQARQVGGMLVGAGTVRSPAHAQAAAKAGAHFAVAPGTDEATVHACAELGLPFFPGVATPTEIARASALGLDVLKVFPAVTVGGPAFLRAVAATYPEMRFIPTGGIAAGSLADYLAVPAVLAVGGSWLVAPELLREGRFDEVERLARAAVEAAA